MKPDWQKRLDPARSWIQFRLKRKRDYWDQAFPDWNYLVLIKVIPQKLDVINYKRGMVNDPVTWKSPSIEFGNH